MVVVLAACAAGPTESASSSAIHAPGAHDEPGDPLPGEADCRFDDAGAWDTLTAGVTAAGDFRIALDDAGALSITHASEPGRVLFASAAHGFGIAARSRLRVEEHQGSFSVEDEPSETCRRPRIRELSTDGGKLRLRGDYEDCASLRFTGGFCQARPGHLSFELRTSDPAFDALTFEAMSDEAERVYGLGEQFRHDTLDLKGHEIPVLVQEGGVGRGHQPISAAVNLVSSGSSGSENSTYYAAPHVLTSRLRSFFLENEEVSVFDLRDADRVRVRTYAPRVRGRILHGRSPLELVERFTEFAGRMPPLPNWVHDGAIVAIARALPESLELVEKLRGAGAEISAVWNQTWPGKAETFIGEQVLWNWAYNPQQHPGWSSYVDALAEKGVRVLCYVNPMFRPVPEDAKPVARDVFAEGLRQGAFVTHDSGEPYMLPVTAFDVALLDLSAEGARTWMKSVIQEEMLGKARCSGWMADFAEALPFDAKLRSGAPAARFHNRYPVEWARLNRELIEEKGLLDEVLVWNRSGFTRSPGASMLVWEGDQLTTWDKYDGLVSALHGLINGGLSGIALNHSDTGGYTSLSAGGVGYVREREQLARWAEMSAFTAVLRTHEGNQPDANYQAYDDDSIDAFARMTKVYKALGFYRRELTRAAAERGWPLVRHLLLEYPEDPESWAVDDEFMLGSELLVAPVKNKCFTWPVCPYDKEVYLPPGRWVHLWSGEALGEAGKGSRVTVKAPIGEPAVFYRQGSEVGATFVKNLRAAGIEVH